MSLPAVEGLSALTDAGIVDAAAGESTSFWDLPLPLPLKKSSCIASASYALRTGELRVRFHTGAEATYPDIDVMTVIGFVKAESPGSYYNSTIRGHG